MDVEEGSQARGPSVRERFLSLPGEDAFETGKGWRRLSAEKIDLRSAIGLVNRRVEGY